MENPNYKIILAQSASILGCTQDFGAANGMLHFDACPGNLRVSGFLLGGKLFVPWLFHRLDPGGVSRSVAQSLFCIPHRIYPADCLYVNIDENS